MAELEFPRLEEVRLEELGRRAPKVLWDEVPQARPGAMQDREPLTTLCAIGKHPDPADATNEKGPPAYKKTTSR